MPKTDMPAWTLEPHGNSGCHPGCPHHGTPYRHRHWAESETPPVAWEPGPVWRLLFRIWGDGGVKASDGTRG